MWYARESFAKMCCKGMIKTELEFMCWKHSGTGTMLCIVMILLHNTSVTFLTGFINKLVIIFFSFIIIITNIVSTTTIPSPSLSLTSHNHHCYLPPASLVVFLFLIYLQFELWCYIYVCVHLFMCACASKRKMKNCCAPFLSFLKVSSRHEQSWLMLFWCTYALKHFTLLLFFGGAVGVGEEQPDLKFVETTWPEAWISCHQYHFMSLGVYKFAFG